MGLNDLYRLDPSTLTWTELTQTVQGTPPKPRGGHGFTALNGRLYVFGGTKGIDFGTMSDRESFVHSISSHRGALWVLGRVSVRALLIAVASE